MATYNFLDKTGLGQVWEKIKELVPTKYADSASAGGSATRTAAIPFGTVDNTSTSTAFTATVEGIDSLYNGVCVWLKNGKVTSASGWTLNINNLGAKPVYQSMAAATAVTTTFNANYTMLFIYNSTRVSGGCWDMLYGYYSNTTVAYGALDYYFRPYAAEAIYRYKFVMQGEDNRLHPITVTNQADATQVAKIPTTAGLRPGRIWYYASTSTINAGAAVGAQTLQTIGYGTTAVYNFNADLPTYRMIYLCGTYDKDKDLFYLYNDNSSPCTSYYTFVPDNTANITLSDYFTVGKYYILLGASYSSKNYFQLFGNNPLYYFDGTYLIPAETKKVRDVASSIPTKTSDLQNDSGFITASNVPDEIFTISVSQEYDEQTEAYIWSKDKTDSEIAAAYEAGKQLMVVCNDTRGSTFHLRDIYAYNGYLSDATFINDCQELILITSGNGIEYIDGIFHLMPYQNGTVEDYNHTWQDLWHAFTNACVYINNPYGDNAPVIIPSINMDWENLASASISFLNHEGNIIRLNGMSETQDGSDNIVMNVTISKAPLVINVTYDSQTETYSADNDFYAIKYAGSDVICIYQDENYQNKYYYYDHTYSEQTPNNQTNGCIVFSSLGSVTQNNGVLQANSDCFIISQINAGGEPTVVTRTTFSQPIGGSTQSDWEEDDSTDDAYILNRPAIRAGDGENSIVEGQIDNSEAIIKTIYITGEANASTFTYTTEEESLPTSGLGGYIAVINGITGENKYQRIKSIDTTNHTITFLMPVVNTSLNNVEVKMYKGYQAALAKNSRASGTSNVAIGLGSCAEGSQTFAAGAYSHAEGNQTSAYRAGSHAEGLNTVAYGTSTAPQHVQGKYNIVDVDHIYAEIVGNGTSSARSNAYTLDWSGNGVYAGKLTVGAGPTNNMDLATKQYVDNAITNVPDDLGDLTDTAISSPSNGQVLKYNSTTSKWVNADETKEIFVITVTQEYDESTGTSDYTKDKTNTEILEAYNADKELIVRFNNSGNYRPEFSFWSIDVSNLAIYEVSFINHSAKQGLVIDDSGNVKFVNLVFSLNPGMGNSDITDYSSTWSDLKNAFSTFGHIYIPSDSGGYIQPVCDVHSGWEDPSYYGKIVCKLVFVNNYGITMLLSGHSETQDGSDNIYMTADAIAGAMEVSVYESNGTLYSNKTYSQICAALNNGIFVYAGYGDDYDILYLDSKKSWDNVPIVFVGTGTYGSNGMSRIQLTIASDDTITATQSSLNIPTASSTTPSADGTGSAGSSTNYARADHVHPKITQTISMTNNVITLSGSDGTSSTVTLPVYNGGVQTV